MYIVVTVAVVLEMHVLPAKLLFMLLAIFPPMHQHIYMYFDLKSAESILIELVLVALNSVLEPA